MDDAERNRTLLQIRQINLEIRNTNSSIASKSRDIEKLQGSMKTTSVKAEVAGEVKSVNPDGGTDNQGNPLPLICIVQTGGFRVKGYVNENNASVLNQGAQVIIRSRVSDQTWKGTISSIDWNNPAQSSNNYYYDSGSSDTGNSSKYPFYVELEQQRRPADGPACVHRAGSGAGRPEHRSSSCRPASSTTPTPPPGSGRRAAAASWKSAA